jgi:hypothetical protein
MSPDQALEIIAMYAFEFSRGKKAANSFKSFWDEFLPFVDTRIEGFAKLSISSISQLAYTMTAKGFHK